MTLFLRRCKAPQSRSNAVHNAVEALEDRLLFTAYYVNSAAKISGTGTSASPWNVLTSVTAYTGFHTGDVVNLTGTFNNQTLTLGSSAAGVTVTSNASSPAAIVESTTYSFTSAIEVSASNVTVSNLKLTGPGITASSDSFYGIWLDNAGSTQYTGDVVNNVTVTGFVFAGLQMAGGTAGFTNASITNSNFSNNQVSGLVVEGSSSVYSNVNLVISNCIASNNAGDAIWWNAHNSGASENSDNGGIFITSVNGAVVEHCTTLGNCYNSSGAVGTWAANCLDVNFEFDQSGDTKTTLAGADGDGFDFDHGVSDSIMQYDYSHANDGTGYFLCAYSGLVPDSDDTIRYCISDDDGLTGGSGISIYGFSENLVPHPVLGAEIYDNTILSPVGASDVSVEGLTPTAAQACTANFMDNIFYSTGGTVVDLSYLTPALSQLTFEGNDYWTTAATGNFIVKWGAAIYPSLTSWTTATGEEMLGTAVVGINDDPLLSNETVSDLPISNVSNLQLSVSSPLRGAGLNLNAYPFADSIFYLNYTPYNVGGSAWSGLGTQDYFDNTLNSGGSHDIGANQVSNLIISGSTSGDTFILKADPILPHTLDVNSSTYSLIGIDSVVVNGLTGNETVTYDFANGPLTNSTGPLSQYGITFNGGSAVNSLTTQDTGSGASSAMPVYFVPGTSVSNSLYSAAGIITIPAGPQIGIATDTFSTVKVSGGAEIAIASPANHSNRTLIVITSSLILAGTTNGWAGTLDLSGNDLDMKNGNIATLNNQVAQGYKNNWQPNGGIINSAAAADTSHLTTLGVIQNSVNGNPSGTALHTTFDTVGASSSDVLIKFTWFGDTNLDGVVDGTDYATTDNGFLFRLTGWQSGDFNYDTAVDGSDYTLIDNAFNNQGAGL